MKCSSHSPISSSSTSITKRIVRGSDSSSRSSNRCSSSAREAGRARMSGGRGISSRASSRSSCSTRGCPPPSPPRATESPRGIPRTPHATAVGRPLSREEARAMLLLRAHVLALGHSGVRAEVIELMVEMLNRDVVPAVPEQGSLGASGDLAPLAGLALPLIGLGRLLTRDGATEPAADGLGRAGLRPLELQAKEGLALVNGTQGMLAIGTLALVRSEQLARAADVIAAMTIEASLGTDAPFDERLQRLRPHPGQAASATNLRVLLDGSPIRESHRASPHLV